MPFISVIVVKLSNFLVRVNLSVSIPVENLIVTIFMCIANGIFKSLRLDLMQC